MSNGDNGNKTFKVVHQCKGCGHKIREGDKLNSILNVLVAGKGGQVRPVALWVCPQCGTISVPLNCHFESERIVEPVGVSVPNKIII